MAWKDIFIKRKYATVIIPKESSVKVKDNLIEIENLPDIKDISEVLEKEYDKDIFSKCPSCGEMLINLDLYENLNVCTKCNYHFRLDSKQRIEITFDEGSAEYFDENMRTLNPLNYPNYKEKISNLQKELEINEGVITGKAKINDKDICFGAMDWKFIMGSMGSVVGEKLARMFEKAIELKLPVVVFSVSGGARMQEGMLSLSQMAKVSAAVKNHSNHGLLYISVLTDPTTGGVTASFASLGDIIIAEPKATIGFAGKRVIEQTIRQKLPEDFQSAEFLLEHGFVDMIVNRKEMKDTLYKILTLHSGGDFNGES
ncbi:acetyl-CoA carboxylase, carboxyltransferase subunit beta [Fervidicella metallireducens]|uniref:acetyl-CoA carboxylase, carboxyltransferase subunit beta n=1 Tax=Fervidicella metallireducens TaxID=655338 RepID=UPI000A967C04